LRKPASELCQRIGYTFRNADYLQVALTHRSAAKKNNERLEFLGDSILSLVITRYLFDRYPNAQEGELSRLRSGLVKGDKLAELAYQLELGDYLILGSGEMKSGGFRRSSILADTLEAIFGAIYLDSDFDNCKKIILSIYQEAFKHIPDIDQTKDPKTRLQEYLQSRKLPLPDYQVIDVIGDPHEQTFTVTCGVSCLDETVQGTGGSRRKAEQSAAQHILEKILND